MPVVVYSIQPDDRNHLIVYGKKSTKAYVRISSEEFKRILEGDTSFLEERCFDEETKKEFKKIAEYIKNIDMIIIKTYVGVIPSFEYRAKKDTIKIDVVGKARVTYSFETIEGKKITIIHYPLQGKIYVMNNR